MSNKNSGNKKKLPEWTTGNIFLRVLHLADVASASNARNCFTAHTWYTVTVITSDTGYTELYRL